MRIVLYITLLFASFQVFATNYYVSNTGSDAAAGTSTGAAWQTISKVNNSISTIANGDSILFNRGDTFTGQLTITKSVKIGAYGSGAKPILNGFTTLSSWTDLGGGIWEATLTNGKASLNLVTINDTVKAVGRYPNSNAASKGYLYYETHNAQVSITDNQLTTTPYNWTGAELCLRGWRWKATQSPITAHSGGTLTSTNPYWEPRNNMGYFIQRDVRTLDRFGEWYFDNSTKKLKMFFGALDPASYTIKASTRDTSIYLGSTTNVSIENIRFTGANVAFVYGNGSVSGYNKIKGCDFERGGNYGVYLYPQNRNTIENNTFNYILSCSVNTSQNYNWGQYNIIKNNVIKNNAPYVGMMPYDTGGSNGNAIMAGSKTLIEYNYIDSVGNSGIVSGQDSVIIRYNYVNYYCHQLDDGAAYYTYGGDVITKNKTYYYRNIARNGVGAIDGTDNSTLNQSSYWYDILGATKGFYFDRGSNNIEIRECSSSNTTAGITLSAARKIDVIDCNFHKSKRVLYIGRKSVSYQQTDTITITGNVLHTTNTNTVNSADYFNENAAGDYSGIDTMDYNYTLSPDNIPYRHYNNTTSASLSYTLSSWRSVYGYDTNGSSINTTGIEAGIQFIYNDTNENKTISLDDPMKSADGTKYYSSIILAPFASEILMIDPNPSPPPSPSLKAITGGNKWVMGGNKLLK